MSCHESRHNSLAHSHSDRLSRENLLRLSCSPSLLLLLLLSMCVVRTANCAVDAYMH